MQCKMCGGNLFSITVIPCCDDCDQNAAYDEENECYTTDLKIIMDKGLERCQVEEEGECQMDSAFGAGCYMFTCKDCNHKENLAYTDGC